MSFKKEIVKLNFIDQMKRKYIICLFKFVLFCSVSTTSQIHLNVQTLKERTLADVTSFGERFIDAN